MTTKLAALLSALLLLAIVGAGCGDDEDEPTGSGQETATQGMTAGDETSTGESGTSTSGDEASTDQADEAEDAEDSDAAADGDEAAAAKVTLEFLQANFEGDGKRACALANAKGKASIQAASTTSTCAEVVADGAPLWRGAEAGDADEVEVEGNRATVRVPLEAPFPAQEITLQRQDGAWKVTDRENLQ